MVGRTRQQQAVHPLERFGIAGLAPGLARSRFAEFGREPFEQLGVGRLLAEFAEVVGRRHQSFPEVVQPEAVHQRAGGDRVRLRRQPVSQYRPPTAVFRSVGRRWDGRIGNAENVGEPGFHFRPLGVRVAPDVQERRRRSRIGMVDRKRHLLRRLRQLPQVVEFLLLGRIGLLRGRVEQLRHFHHDLGSLGAFGRSLVFRRHRFDRLIFNGFHFLDDPGHAALPFAEFILVNRPLFGWRNVGLAAGHARVAVVAVVADVLEERHQFEVVCLPDRIAFVVVAPGAVDGHPEDRLAGDRHQIVEPVRLGLQAVGRFIVPNSQSIIARGDDRIDVVRPSFHFVAGDLFPEELTVRFVVIETANHIVAVAPSVRFGAVPFIPVALGVPDDVEPVPAPLLAVFCGRQQTVDQLLPRFNVRVLHEGIDLFRSRWQTGEVVIRSANQRRFVRRSDRGELLGCEFRLEERIHGVTNTGHGRPLQGLVGPVQFLRLGEALGHGFDDGRFQAVGWVRQTVLNPFGEYGDVRRFQFPGGGHLVPLFGMVDRLHQQALRRFAGDGGRAGVAPFERGAARAQIEFALEFLRVVAVALHAVRYQQRLHGIVEELHLLGRERRLGIGG